MNELLDREFLRISLLNWLYAGAVACVSFAVITTLLRLARVRLAALARRTSAQLDDALVGVLSTTSPALVLLASVLIGATVLELPGAWSARVSHLWFIVIALQVGLWGNRAIALWTADRRDRDQGASPQQASATASMLSIMLRVLLWATVLLGILANLGVNITAFVASLGIGGVAVALAVQNILSDLFASLAIAFDKPFEVGDFIVVGDVLGSVEHVGLKTTRLRSLSGEQVVYSNTELLKNTIRNFKRMYQRRVQFGFGVTYDTDHRQLEALPGVVRGIVESIEKTRFDRAHFKAFGASSLDFEVVYFVLDPDFNVYMDIQQRINLELVRALAERGVEFAFPTRTLHVSTVPTTEDAGQGRRPRAVAARP